MFTYNGLIPTQYHQIIKQLFEAVYQNNIQEVDIIVIKLIQDILRKYPQQPKKEDPNVKGDLLLLEFLGVDFNLSYGDWLNNTKKMNKQIVHDENNFFLYKNLSNGKEMNNILTNLRFYLMGLNSESFDQLNKRISEYKKN